MKPGFAAAVIAWQRRCGRRGLPWMKPDPYARWVSEIMLQQTQVAVVRDYYLRFMQAFPTVEALAQADEEAVLELWAGLGYYSRARRLHACARAVAAGGGRFPETAEALMRLPGIGRSTAGAIASFAFGAAEPVVDGNVKRVLARVLALAAPQATAAFDHALWQAAQALIAEAPAGEAGVYNQGMMDLGALVCARAGPRCEACPVRDWCRAARQGDPGAYPAPRARRARPVRRVTFLARLRGRGDALEVMLVRREGAGVWQGLWALPELGGAPPGGARCAARFTHDFTHYRLEAEVLWLRQGEGEEGAAGARWLRFAQIGGAALPAPMKRVLPLVFSAALA
ncbi:MAG: A/G-specific adenine glycosylase [Duodenibacillus sp.]|nr:A/G-specific adenine glycosylase [Duodenibacillus sp.]